MHTCSNMIEWIEWVTNEWERANEYKANFITLQLNREEKKKHYKAYKQKSLIFFQDSFESLTYYQNWFKGS